MELGQDGEVGVKRNPVSSSDTEREHRPFRPPMQAHFRDRMRYTATQLDKVIAEIKGA